MDSATCPSLTRRVGINAISLESSLACTSCLYLIQQFDLPVAICRTLAFQNHFIEQPLQKCYSPASFAVAKTNHKPSTNIHVVPDFEIKSCSRKCAATQKEIGRGEAYYSIVRYNEQGELVREDYHESSWEGPTDDCVGWWRSEIPALEGGRVYWAPNDVLYAYFDEVLKQSQHPERAFVMALLLVRRRMMKLEYTKSDENGKRMILKSPRHESLLEIREVQLTPQQINQLQMELGEHLFTDRAAGGSEAEES